MDLTSTDAFGLIRPTLVFLRMCHLCKSSNTAV